MTTFRALRALYWLHEHRDRPVPALPAEVLPPDDARTVYDELRERNALADTLTLDGSFEFYLTPSGRVQASNAHDTYRHELALRRVLEWMAAGFDVARLEHNEQADDFSGRLSPREIRDATHYLAELGLCKGSKNANAEFFHVEITPRGRAAARQSQLIDAAPVPRGSTTNISADNYGQMTIGNQAVGGQGHTMTATVTQGASLAEVLQAISQLRSNVEAAPGLDDADREELLDEIDTLTEKASKRGLGWLKATLLAFSMQLADTAGQALADQTVAISSLIGG